MGFFSQFQTTLKKTVNDVASAIDTAAETQAEPLEDKAPATDESATPLESAESSSMPEPPIQPEDAAADAGEEAGVPPTMTYESTIDEFSELAYMAVLYSLSAGDFEGQALACDTVEKNLDSIKPNHQDMIQSLIVDAYNHQETSMGKGLHDYDAWNSLYGKLCTQEPRGRAVSISFATDDFWRFIGFAIQSAVRAPGKALPPYELARIVTRYPDLLDKAALAHIAVPRDDSYWKSYISKVERMLDAKPDLLDAFRHQSTASSQPDERPVETQSSQAAESGGQVAEAPVPFAANTSANGDADGSHWAGNATSVAPPSSIWDFPESEPETKPKARPESEAGPETEVEAKPEPRFETETPTTSGEPDDMIVGPEEKSPAQALINAFAFKPTLRNSVMSDPLLQSIEPRFGQIEFTGCEFSPSSEMWYLRINGLSYTLACNRWDSLMEPDELPDGRTQEIRRELWLEYSQILPKDTTDSELYEALEAIGAGEISCEVTEGSDRVTGNKSLELKASICPCAPIIAESFFDDDENIVPYDGTYPEGFVDCCKLFAVNVAIAYRNIVQTLNDVVIPSFAAIRRSHRN